MIYTLTPNPALDISGNVDQIIQDEKNYVHEELRCPGGNGINAARIIKRLRAPVIASGFLGGGIGKEVETLIQNEKVQTRFIKIAGHTRVSVTVANKATHRQTRLSFPGPEIRQNEIKALFQFVEKIKAPSLLVIGGSLPPGFSTATLKKLLQIARQKKLPTIVDVPAKILKSILPHSSLLMIKPNLTELQDLLNNKNITTLPEVVQAVQPLLTQVPLICVSSVEKGAALITPFGTWFGKGPKIKSKGSVGAGDSMVGAITAHLWKNGLVTERGILLAANEAREIPNLLRWGLAAALATVSTPGTELGAAKKITELYPQIQIQKLSEGQNRQLNLFVAGN